MSAGGCVRGSSGKGVLEDSDQHGRLSSAHVRDNLLVLPGWRLDAGGGVLHRSYEFCDLRSALGFMLQVAARCDLMEHYPEWTNSRTRLDVRLTTPERGGVSHRDLALAAHMEELFKRGLR